MTFTQTALILDFGGVLTTDLWASIRACAHREGLPDEALLDLLHHDHEIRRLFVALERGDVSQTAFEARLAAAAGISPDGLLARMCATLEPDEAMLAAVATLRDGGVRIGVLSNSWGSGYFDPYDGYRLEDRADVVVISDRVRLRKPEPAIFALVLRRLGVEAKATVFVDDVAANLPAARALGMGVIHHRNASETIVELGHRFGIPLRVAGRVTSRLTD
ncbi:MAG: HAD family phosphatase [Actinobacteria bacterium]|nr:HAD family phosphatase [Actinomycetota bacterium]MBI3686551.1 HAD family phosphatase [Actinomycetota bacterium]